MTADLHTAETRHIDIKRRLDSAIGYLWYSSGVGGLRERLPKARRARGDEEEAVVRSCWKTIPWNGLKSGSRSLKTLKPLRPTWRVLPRLDELLHFFRSLAKRLYPNATAGLTVANNAGDNQLRYSIDARIESDGSDGINNAKIFCFDLTLLFKGANHAVEFLLHDSRLFDGVDSRQVAEMIRIVGQHFGGTQHQYIASLNQNQLDELRSILGDDDFQKLIINNMVLQLSDENDEGKLLGLTVDL